MWTPKLDAIIREGYARGWSGAWEAINKIQSLHPKWRSHNIWERAKELGFDQRYVQKRPPWSDADDALLRDFAQEFSVKAIARLLIEARDQFGGGSQDWARVARFETTTRRRSWRGICA